MECNFVPDRRNIIENSKSFDMKLEKQALSGNNLDGLAKFRLINGTYTADEAGEILLSLINHKIDFHETHLFACEERNERDRLNSEQRIEQLKESAKLVEEMIEQARQQGASISVESIAHIRINQN